MKQLVLAACFALLLTHTFAQQPGTLDNIFGEKGKTITKFEDGFAICVAGTLQADDKIIAAGSFVYYNDEEGITYPMLVRYKTDGSIDSSFGDKGRLLSLLPKDFYYAQINTIAMQADGKIVAAGYGRSISSFTFDVVLVRYKTDGSPDSSFGKNGWVTTDLTMNEFANAIAIQDDGKIALNGFWLDNNVNTQTQQFLSARYLPDGSPDKSFGSNGTVLTAFDVPFDQANAIAVQKDGKIISAGFTTHQPPVPGKYTSFALARYLVNGDLDPSFGNNGKVITDFGANGEVINSLLLQSDGKIVVAGYSNLQLLPKENVALARYNTDGTLDKTFGNEGKVVTLIPKNNSQGNSVVLQKNNKIVVGGFTSVSGTDLRDFMIARYDEDGSADSSFGSNGVALTDFGYSDVAYSLNIQQDGKIVAIGSNYNESFTGIELARYYGDPIKQTNPIAKKIKRWIKNHTLQWQPVNDDDVSYYSIQQSSNGVNGFREIGRIAASNKPQAASTVYSYSLKGSQLTAQSSANYYRITAVSTTGSNIISDVIADESVSSTTISPNPVKDVMKISGLPANQKTTINIVNRNGNIIQSAICNSSVYMMNVSGLHSGLYNVQVTSKGKTQTLKFVKE